MEKIVIKMHLRNIAFVARPYVKTFLRLVILVVSTSMAFILSGINPFFSSVFCIIAVAEFIKLGYVASLWLNDGRAGEWVDASDMPVWLAFLITFFLASIVSLVEHSFNGLLFIFLGAIALVVAVAWVLILPHRQEKMYQRLIERELDLE